MLDGFDDKSAYFICTIAYSPGPGQEIILFQERTDVSYSYSTIQPFSSQLTLQGKIVPARGSGTNTWNPNFEVNGKTFGEMSTNDRRLCGARSKALAKLHEWILQNPR